MVVLFFNFWNNTVFEVAYLSQVHYHTRLRSPIDQWYSTGGTRTPGGTRRHLRGYVDDTICITCIMYQQLWGYKVEEKLYLGVREQKRLNTTAIDYWGPGLLGTEWH
jgi:hypothetical protein